MRGFFRNRFFIAAIIAVALALTMAVISALSGGRASPVSNAVEVLTMPLKNAASSVADWFSSIYGYMYEFDKLKAENESLKKTIAEMDEKMRESVDANEENERLRKLIGLREKRRDFEFEMAAIVSRDVSNWSSDFSINRGSVHGIETGDCVISEEGYMVGYITEVGYNWSTVTTVIDTAAEIGAKIFRTGLTAVCEGDFDLMRNGELKMTYIPKDEMLLNGDVILTSGKGGLFPGDLEIGQVTGVFTERSGMAQYAVIRPTADIARLTQVFVIKSYEIVD